MSPSIFRKSKGPIIFASQNSQVASNTNIEYTFKSYQASGRKGEGANNIREAGLQDFDTSQCAEMTDIYCNI